MYLILHTVLQNINVMFEKYMNLFYKVSILVELHTQNSYILFFLCVSLETTLLSERSNEMFYLMLIIFLSLNETITSKKMLCQHLPKCYTLSKWLKLLILLMI